VELYALRDIVDTLKESGANMVAITPQLPEHNVGLIKKHKLNFEMLSDPGNNYAAELGLRYTFPEDLQQIYNKVDIMLPEINGDNSWTMPIPGRFVVDTSGIVRAADVDVDYTHRPEPSKTIEDVKALG
jgi:peroxiredoxin